MVSTVQNTDVKQKDADHAVVVAVTSRSAFEPEPGDGVYREGVAFKLLQALQKVNERLLEENPSESLLFDIVLITTDTEQQQHSNRIITSTRHYGLEISRFSFCAEEDFTESLLQNHVHLFLTTDQHEAQQASQNGVLCALLDPLTASCQSDQLRVMFCEDDVIKPDTSPLPGRQQANQTLSCQLGEMRGRFGLVDSPLSLVLVTSHGNRQSCGVAMRTLRSRGVTMDEAYCLAGAPRGPIISLLQPHFLLSDGCSEMEE